MKLALLRTHPAARTLPWLALVGVAAGAMAVGVGRMGSSDDDLREEFTSIHLLVPLFEVLFAAWMVALWHGARERVDEARLALPVSARTWVGVHATVLLLLCWLPLALVTLVVAIGTGSIDVGLAVLAPAGATGLAWTTWVALCIAWQPARLRFDSTPLFVAVTVACMALAWTGIFSPAVSAGLSLTVLVPTAALASRGGPPRFEVARGGHAKVRPGVRSLKHLPEAQTAAEGQRPANVAAQTTPALVAPTERWTAPSAPEARQPRAALRAWIVRRTWGKGRTAWGLFGLVVWVALTAPPNPGPFRGGIGVLMVVWMTWITATTSMRVLRDVGHLPIPRARMTHHILLPPFLALLVGAGATIGLDAIVNGSIDRGAVEIGWRDRDVELDEEATTGPETCMEVPGALLRPVLGSAPILVTSPSGESANVEPKRLIPGLPLAMANLYDFDSESSIDFVAWQLSRALRDAYGMDVEPRELRERHLRVIRGRINDDELYRLFAEHVEARPTPHPGRPGWVLLLVALAWAISAWIATWSNVPPNEPSRRRLFGIAARFGPFLLAAAFVSMLVLQMRWTLLFPPLSDAFAAACLDAVGGRPWVLPLAALAFAALAYYASARRFARLEVPPPLRNTWYRRA